MTVRVITGDCRAVLRTLPDESVHCVVTSPPYWGLRDYGVNSQIGLEAEPAAYIAELVAVFREVRRILRDDGTVWLNLGDSYAGSGRGGYPGGKGTLEGSINGQDQSRAARHKQAKAVEAGAIGRAWVPAPVGLKQKDLIGIPWMAAFALRADGWYLRRDIIWHKSNPMPESVQDRPTGAHEYIFLLSKSPVYYYDADAIAEPVSPNTHARLSQDVANQIGSARANGGRKTNGNMKAVGRNPKTQPAGSGIKNNDSFLEATCLPVTHRNKRTVWTVSTEAFKGAHFATFPSALIEPCIKAGSPGGGVILDPFGGAGTTGLVAARLKRDAILIELNPEYADMARRRITADAPLFGEVA